MKNNIYHFKIECFYQKEGPKIENIVEDYLLLYLKEFEDKTLIN